MKTVKYNPSDLEVSFAKALEDLKEDIQKRLPNTEILKIEDRMAEDNPLVKFYLQDNDGDPHEIVLKVIQTPDRF